MSRRRSRRVAPGRRAGSVLMASGGSAPRRRRGRRPPPGGRLRLGAFLRGIGGLAGPGGDRGGLMSRRRSGGVAPGRRAGSVLRARGGSAPRRRRGRRPPPGGRLRLGAFLRGIGVLAVLAAIAGGVVVWQTHTTAAQDR